MGSEDALGKYVYCVIRSGRPCAPEVRGIGEDCARVHTVDRGELAAVVSDSPVVDYLRARANLLAHTLVLEEVMRDHTLLPVKFGTVAPSEQVVSERLLEQRRVELAGLLDEMENRVELGLKAFWKEEALFKEITEENPGIRALRDVLRARSQGISYQDRMRLGEMVQEAIARKGEAEAEALVNRLRPLAYKCKVNEALGERTVLNAAFLVDREREAEFDEAVRRLDNEMSHREAFRFVGPVPPYNFVNVVVRWDE